MKATEYIESFKNWAENSPFPELARNFCRFEDIKDKIDEYKKLEQSIGLRLPDSFFAFLEKKGRLCLEIDFIDPIDIFQDYEDSLNKSLYWHIGAPSFNGLIFMSPDEIVSAHEAIQFALGKNHPRGKNWFPIASTRSDREEGWLIDQTFKDQKNNSPIAPFYMDCIFRYDDTLEEKEKLTMSIDNFDDFIGDYLFRLKRQLLSLDEPEIRILIDEHMQKIKNKKGFSIEY